MAHWEICWMTAPRVVFIPSGKRGKATPGETILQAARRLGVDLDSVCGGRGLCGRCQVDVAEGEFAKLALTSSRDHVTPGGAVEARYAERRELPSGRRLGCQAQIIGDLVVDVPPTSQLHRQVVRKEARAVDIEIDPLVTLHYVEVAKPTLGDPLSDFARLQAALCEQWGLSETRAGLALLSTLQPILRDAGWTVTAAVRRDGEIVALYPGLLERVFGVAIDIGSTTLASHLCDLATGEVVAAVGAMNPQIRFGEDLMSRLSYAIQNTGSREEMTQAVRVALDALTADAARQANVDTGCIVEATVAGNPIMHHLFLGIDPRQIGQAPFPLAFNRAFEVPSRELGLNLATGARVYVLPCIAGYVGADTAAVALAEAPHRSEEPVLIVDVGTNAEILFGDHRRLLAASSPTGPAFEGAQISCGQRAAPGAVERVRIDHVTLEPRFKVIGCELWSDEAGFGEATHALSVTGVCGSGLIEVVAEMFLAGILFSDGTFDGAQRERSPRIEPFGRSFAYVLHQGPPRIAITQADVRAVQLAKAALYAGAKLLTTKLGVGSPRRITLVGAFGSQIDPLRAMTIGLIPDCDLTRVASGGNAAGTGARIALLNRAARAEIENLTGQIEKIETTSEANFESEFIAAMAFPHASDAFPNLARQVELPERRTSVRRRKRE
jgi:uncharacterized 2Fe-2S/4Fe-4S cluster protein (DUF4445 family)